MFLDKLPETFWQDRPNTRRLLDIVEKIDLPYASVLSSVIRIRTLLANGSNEEKETLREMVVKHFPEYL